ncbi:BMC domain-containing protein [Enterococcus raffinosus]|uniref:BMC domain-containing protein n=1 Tax=Enterococcus raffinosus TaxID=71452 RepID=A0AAW8TCH1_9ENTE|nr:BMC domain-containing protein [Enterococcus raffinosus]MDT2521822.1 BMC domain-containing protein [Enterococcus raffinosus]MDT2529131.1 BMC domain-containing protein [Enterococcus raffinosus]MDT2532663.1 BMC domain-containing protein [Enterococcus raffinosus]MDT2544470.1 BMC domain-containing protein [Enterococcus raffinosus]MDT2556399.1 BMC domain-containing protein [Enterococcus raffinosus]
MKQAIGLVEVKGLASAIEVSDTMVKVANVELLGVEKAKGFGWMTVKVAGDVGAVKAAVDAGKAKAVTNNVYLSALVIPRPANNLEKFFFAKEQEDVHFPVERAETTPMVSEPVEEKIEKAPEEPQPEVKPTIEKSVEEKIDKKEAVKEKPIKEEPIKQEPVKEKSVKEEPKKKKNPAKGSKKSSESKKKK